MGCKVTLVGLEERRGRRPWPQFNLLSFPSRFCPKSLTTHLGGGVVGPSDEEVEWVQSYSGGVGRKEKEAVATAEEQSQPVGRSVPASK